MTRKLSAGRLFAGILIAPSLTVVARGDDTTYRVVINRDEQYSIWPASREIPIGWHDAGMRGTKQECLEYIKEHWTDMRPLSLRRRMEKVR